MNNYCNIIFSLILHKFYSKYLRLESIIYNFNPFILKYLINITSFNISPEKVQKDYSIELINSTIILLKLINAFISNHATILSEYEWRGLSVGFLKHWFAIRISVRYRYTDINHQKFRTHRFREDSNPNQYKYMGFELKCYPVINI
jgi:hypothetical protein